MNAGEFSIWIDEFTRTMQGKVDGSVPCDGCVGCCTSSKFVHIHPEDEQAISAIPRELLFQAPGLPNGYCLLGYDQQGHCPMLKDGQCSIYGARPRTCRQFDCRVLAATGVEIDDESEVIMAKARSWKFQFTTDRSTELYHAVKLASSFLDRYRHEFPDGFVPRLSTHLSVMAVRVHSMFTELSGESMKTDRDALIQAIVHKYSIDNKS